VWGEPSGLGSRRKGMEKNNNRAVVRFMLRNGHTHHLCPLSMRLLQNTWTWGLFESMEKKKGWSVVKNHMQLIKKKSRGEPYPSRKKSLPRSPFRHALSYTLQRYWRKQK
jgi:hypothetical protein